MEPRGLLSFSWRLRTEERSADDIALVVATCAGAIRQESSIHVVALLALSPALV